MVHVFKLVFFLVILSIAVAVAVAVAVSDSNDVSDDDDYDSDPFRDDVGILGHYYTAIPVPGDLTPGEKCVNIDTFTVKAVLVPQLIWTDNDDCKTSMMFFCYPARTDNTLTGEAGCKPDVTGGVTTLIVGSTGDGADELTFQLSKTAFFTIATDAAESIAVHMYLPPPSM